MKIIIIVIVVIAILYIIGTFAPDESSNKNNSHSSHSSASQKKTPPPHFRRWNGNEFDSNGHEMRCGECSFLRTEEETGRVYCSKYPGYVDQNNVCDSYESAMEALVDGLAKIVLGDKYTKK